MNSNQDPKPQQQQQRPLNTLELEDQQLGDVMQRLKRALGPVLAGLVLDFADFATFGPLGLIVGPIVGIIIGWWMGKFYRLSIGTRVGLALVAGIYCALPVTNFLPLATMVSAAIRFFESPPSAGEAMEPSATSSDSLPLTPSELIQSKDGREGGDDQNARKRP